MKKCKKCNSKIKIFYGIANTNIAFGDFSTEKLYGNDPQNVGICTNKDCDRDGLFQALID